MASSCRSAAPWQLRATLKCLVSNSSSSTSFSTRRTLCSAAAPHRLRRQALSRFSAFPSYKVSFSAVNLQSRRSASASGSSSSEAEEMERQFEEFRQQLEDSSSVRERLRSVVADIDSLTRVMQADLQQVHYTKTPQGVVSKTKELHFEKLRGLYAQLAEIIKGTPGQYYRYHDHWRHQTQISVYLIVFLHWLETGDLLSYTETQQELGLNQDEFGLDIDDYLIGLCNMSNEMPRYVRNQVNNEDYECPKRVSKFLSDLYAAFRILNLRNDLVRKKFDGIKYDLKNVEEALYDVKIRGLLPSESNTVPKQD